MTYARKDPYDNVLPMGTVQMDSGLLKFKVRAIPMSDDMRSILLKMDVKEMYSSEDHWNATIKELSPYFANMADTYQEANLQDWSSRYVFSSNF